MPTIYQFIFFYVIVPYGAVILFGVFPCLAKRESVETDEGAKAMDCPLTKIWTWLTLFALLIIGVSWFYKSIPSINDLLSSYIISGSYFLAFLVLGTCALVVSAARLVLGMTKKNSFRLLNSSVLIALGVIAVLSMLFGSTFIVEFFNRAFLITH